VGPAHSVAVDAPIVVRPHEEVTLSPPSTTRRSRSVLIALFVVFLWATSWVLIKFGLQEIPALTFAGIRYALAWVCLLPFAVGAYRKTSPRPVSRRVLSQLVALGLLLYAVTQGAVFIALADLPAVTVNLLWSFTSAAVALLSIIALRERPSCFQWFGVALALLGAIIYFHPAGFPRGHSIGIVASIIGVLGNAIAVVLGRQLNRSGEMHPLVVTAISMGVGSLTLLLIGATTQGVPRISAVGWAIIAWLAVVNTAFAFTLWNYTLRTLSATESSIINGTMLIWIPVLALIFLSETISTRELVGLVVAAIGTLLVQLRSTSSLLRPIRKRKNA
jgi:drug/metabolite transporter (DMT)-like permease